MAEDKTGGGARSERESAPPGDGPISVVIAVGLLAVSAYVTIQGFRIPQPEGWQTAPGMLAILLGSSLFVMALVLLTRAIRNGALSQRDSDNQTDSSFSRVAIALVCIGIFYFGLLAYLPFEPAAIVFLLAMTWIFWPEGKLWIKVTVAVCLPIFISLAFRGGFGIPLPGQGNLVLFAQYLWVTW